MSLVNHGKLLRSLLVAALAFVLSLGGVALASPAHAATMSGNVAVLCDEALDGSATVYVSDVTPQDLYSVVMEYSNGYSKSELVVDYLHSAQFPVFGPYGEPIGNEGDDVTSVTIWLVSYSGAHEASATTTFTRTPQCGERPNRAPSAGDTAGSGSRYDDSIVAPVMNAGDPDGDPLSFSLTSTPNHGTAEVMPPTAAYSGARALIVYHPDGSYLGDEVLTFQVSDGRGGTDTATATVTVEDSTPVTASAPTFVEPSRSAPNGQVIVPSQAGVRYQFDSAVRGEFDASGMTIDVPQGTAVTIQAFATQAGTTLVGTKSWQRTFTYLLKVVNRNSAGTEFINKVWVSNPNSFGVWFRYGDFTAPGTTQDGRIWLEPKSGRTVSTSRKMLDWSATGGDSWSDAGRTATIQIRPKGGISINCRGTREIVKYYMNNYGSTRTVKFEAHIGRGTHQLRNVAGGTSYVMKYTYRPQIKPGARVRLTAHLPWGEVTLAKAIVPRSCG